MIVALGAATDISGWNNLFVAAAGASAALAGLVFVAVSINIERILQYRGLPERALVTLLLLVGALVVSLICLVPDAEPERLGALMLIQSVAWISVLGFFTLRSFLRGDDGSGSHYVSRVGLPSLGAGPWLIGAVALLAGSVDGMAWVAGGVIGAIVAASLNAWVLLVEILR